MSRRAKSMGKLKVSIAFIDPDSARALLNSQYRSRPLNKRHFAALFFEDDQLVDGQARLSACVKAGEENDQ